MSAHEPPDEALVARPEYFYKFRNFDKPEYIKDAILEHKFFFDSPNNFNDPFECLPSFSFDATEVELIEYYKRIVARNFPHLSSPQQIVRALEYRLTTERERQPGTPEYKAYHIASYSDWVLPKLPMFCVSASARNVTSAACASRCRCRRIRSTRST